MRTKEELLTASDGARNMAEIVSRLGMRRSSKTYKSIKNQMDHYGIPVPYGVKTYTRHTDEMIFSVDSSYGNKSLRKKVLKEELLEYKCQGCGISDWQDKPLTLQLDHINGNNRDNRLENLRFLCPNCHAQTDTWGNR
tara:strand:- start:49 stop:462 length:414 start_codon:yes stop_codon:yes gene_type:complete